MLVFLFLSFFLIIHVALVATIPLPQESDAGPPVQAVKVQSPGFLPDEALCSFFVVPFFVGSLKSLNDGQTDVHHHLHVNVLCIFGRKWSYHMLNTF